MPITSNQISGMVGGQVAMFSNQAQFSQQIGGAVGTSPMGMAGGGMQNPYPGEDTGARIAGGMGMALPGVGAGLGMAGMLAGGKLGWMDPFTAGARGFAGGSGLAGGGAMQTLGHVGRTFASGGMRAGLGALGGGAMGAAAAAAPALAIGAGLQFAGGNIYQGAQNIAEVGGMANQYFGSQYGQPGARPGGQMARQEIKRVTGALREIVNDDTRTSMEELKRVMDQAGRMGMLGGIGSAQEFKQKFQGMVRQMRQVADFMGSSLEEVAPLMGQMRQMGLWTAGDVTGTLAAGRTAGGAQPQMMQTMQAGAQMSHAMGGGLRAGALMGQQQFGMIQAARRGGTLSEQDIAEFTGGQTGATGQQAVAQRLTGIMTQLGQTPGHRLMMAGLGEVGEEGTFTGQADEEMMRRFKRGEISVDELQRMGRGKTRGKGGALSFHRVQHRLSQDVAQTGGLEALGQMVNQVAERIGGPREEVQHRLLMQMGNMNERDAEMVQRLLQDLPQIQDQQARSARDAVDQAFDAAQRKGTQGWSAFKTSIGRLWEQAGTPFQEVGEKLATSFGEMGDELSDKVSGRVRGISMGRQERGRLMQTYGAEEAMGALPQGMGQEWARGDWQTNMNLRMRQPGFLGRTLLAGAAGGAMGSAAGPIGTVLGVGAGIGSQVFGLGEGATPRQQALQAIGAGIETGAGGDIELGGGVTTSNTRMQRAVRRAFKRAQSPTVSALGIEDEGRLNKWQSTLGKVMGKYSRELSRLKKEDPKKYADRVLEFMKDEGAPTEGMDKMKQLDYLAAAQEKEGFGVSDQAVDFKGQARDVGLPPQTPDELAREQRDLLSEMVAAGGGLNVAEEMLKGAGIGAVLGGGILSVPLAILGAGVGGFRAAFKDTGITNDMVEQAMTGAGSDIFSAWVGGELSLEDARTALTRTKGGDKIRGLLDRIEEHGLEDKFKTMAPKFERMRAGQAWMEGLQDIRGIAARAPEKLRGLGAGSQVKYRSLRALMTGGPDEPGKLSGAEWTTAQEEATSLAESLTSEELKGMRGQRGGISGMLQAIRAAQDISKGTGGIGEEDLTKIKKQFKGFGIDITQRESMGELLRGGIDVGEREQFGERLLKAAQAGIAGSAEAEKSHTARMNELLGKYTTANTDFVKAVHEALGDKIKNAHASVQEMERVSKPQTVGAL